MRLQTRWTLLLLPMLVIGCSDDSKKTSTETDATADGSSDTSADTGGSGADTTTDTGDSDGSAQACAPREPQEGDAANPDCDPLNDGHCAMPWPSNLYLADDATTATGKRLTFGATTLPKNFQNIYIDPAPYSRRDGYSVGTPLLVHFANLDTTGMADERDLSASLADDAKVLWFKVASDGTLSRVPYFVELDSQDPDPAKKTLFVRPGVILEEATHYVVAFRNLNDTNGAPIAASAAFAALRDGRIECDDRVAGRAAHFDEAVFGPLEAAGIDRASLTLAWDFNTMSGENMHGDILRMRDEVLASIDADPAASALTVTQITAYSEAENPYIAFDMQGTFLIPNYTEEKTFYQGTDGVTGYVLHRDANDRIVASGTTEMPVWIRVPRSAVGTPDPAKPNRLVQFGHGLFGSGAEITTPTIDKVAFDHHLIYFSTSWAGMAEEDYGRANFMVFDLNRFVWLTDRLQQGIVNFLALGRLMKTQAPTFEPFTSRNITVDNSEMYYSGISQGGILGATYMALTTDVARGHVGVPGQNFTSFLHRSGAFDQFFVALKGALRTPNNVAVALSTVQLLWDSTDSVSHYRHITAEPYPGTPAHTVLAGPAKGDYLVSPLTMEVVARTDIGFPIMANYDDERTVSLATEAPYPRTGSGTVLWDFGNEWPTPGNHPPEVDVVNGDPHGKPRAFDLHNEQMDTFFRTGQIVDLCGGDGCHPN